MELWSDLYVVKKIKKKTKARIFGDIKVGDRLMFSMDIQSVQGASGGGKYASYVTVLNLTQRTSDASKSQTEIAKYLTYFDLEKDINLKSEEEQKYGNISGNDTNRK